MEVKDAALVFLALLSALLFGCLTFSVMHNANQIAELKAQQQKIEEEYVHFIKLANDATTVLQQSAANGPEVVRVGENNKGLYRLRRNAATGDNGSPTSTVSLLSQALSEIVKIQLNDYLDCDNIEDEIRCTIQPGPKGDQGEPGPPGKRGAKGEMGTVGLQGEKGQLGYPGYKGEMGQKGEIGPQGPVGPQGNTGSSGPVATLAQNGCNWQYTDNCGHHCGIGIFVPQKP